MDWLTVFGLAAVSVMVALYAFERRHHLFTLGFACACVLASIYGFLAGVWPFGLVEVVWAIVAFFRWRQRFSR